MRNTAALLAGLVLMAGQGWAEMKSSVTQFGITWTFDQPYEAGQFANGDWWILGPVTIMDITPKDTAPDDGIDMHGTTINPAGDAGRGNAARPLHGWDSRIAGSIYVASMNIAKQLPYTVQPNSSVLSAISREETDVTGKRQLNTIAILTALSSPAPGGSFRPTYLGIDKTIRWNKNQIDYSKLRSLPPVPYMPTLASVEARYEKSYIVIGSEYSANYISPWYNLPYPGENYGREHEKGASEAALSLALNYSNAEKEKLAIRFIQWGLDIYGAATNSISWAGNGGHAGGRKLPLLLAGVLLNDADIIDRADGTKYRFTFAEDQQHFYVNQADITTPRHVDNDTNRHIDPYSPDMLGMPEWGPNHVEDPTHSGSNWYRFYRNVVCPKFVGHALTVHLMGLENVWNWPAFFDYYNQRCWPIESTIGFGGTANIETYVGLLWKAYRSPVGKVPYGYVSLSPANWQSEFPEGPAVINQDKEYSFGTVRTRSEFSVRVGPNPMRERAVFKVVARGAGGRIAIYTRSGQMVHAESITACRGMSLHEWDGTDPNGRAVEPGMYVYTVTMDGRQTTGRLVVMAPDKTGR